MRGRALEVRILLHPQGLTIKYHMMAELNLSEINSAFKNLLMRGNRKVLMNLVAQHISIDRKQIIIDKYKEETGEEVSVKHKRKRI